MISRLGRHLDGILKLVKITFFQRSAFPTLGRKRVLRVAIGSFQDGNTVMVVAKCLSTST